MGNNKSNQNDQECEFEEINNSMQTFKEEEHKELQEHQLVRTHNKAPRPKSQPTRSISNNENKFDVTGMNSEEIGAKIKSMYQKIDGVWTCNECGKISNNKTTSGDIRLHVETHLDGLCYTCNICSMEFRSKNLLRHHKKNHQNFKF